MVKKYDSICILQGQALTGNKCGELIGGKNKLYTVWLDFEILVSGCQADDLGFVGGGVVDIQSE